MQNNLVLVVDDEALIAYDIGSTVEHCGYELLGPAFSIAQARELVKQRLPEIALLDINVRREVIWTFAAELQERGCTIILISGEVSQRKGQPGFEDAPCLHKPTTPDEIVEALGRVKVAP